MHCQKLNNYYIRYMNLYTILIDFEDRTIGVGQYEAEGPCLALKKFVESSESLSEYDRSKLLSIVNERSKQDNLLIHIANEMKGLWAIFFGTDLLDIPELSTIYGGHIIQTDQNGPVRKVNIILSDKE